MAQQCVIEDITAREEGDAALGKLLVAADADAERFLADVFGFLQRKTNFFKQGDPRARVLSALKAATGDAASAAAAAPSGDLKTGFLGASKPAAAAPAAPKAAPKAATVRCGAAGGRRNADRRPPIAEHRRERGAVRPSPPHCFAC